MDKALAVALRLFLILLTSIPWCASASAQTIQQDRRIEEDKREDLKPTVATPQLPTPPEAPQAAPSPPAPLPISAIYFGMLAQKRIAFRYDAAKALVILMGVDEQHIDLDAQVAYLRTQGFLPSRFRTAFDPMEPLRKGLLAYMLRQALGIRGGIALQLFGQNERYALKELAFQGFLSPGLPNDLVSGSDLVQAIAAAARYKVARLPKPTK